MIIKLAYKSMARQPKAPAVDSSSTTSKVKMFKKPLKKCAEIKSFRKMAFMIPPPVPVQKQPQQVKSFRKQASVAVPATKVRCFTKEAQIEIKESHKGSLHEALGIPEGEPIPTSLLKAKQKTATGPLAKKINFALNARKWRH